MSRSDFSLQVCLPKKKSLSFFSGSRETSQSSLVLIPQDSLRQDLAQQINSVPLLASIFLFCFSVPACSEDTEGDAFLKEASGNPAATCVTAKMIQTSLCTLTLQQFLGAISKDATAVPNFTTANPGVDLATTTFEEICCDACVETPGYS